MLLGGVVFSVEEVVAACGSLRRIAERVQDTEETGRCFHDVIIPRLLSLALQAALQGELELTLKYLPPQNTHPSNALTLNLFLY